MQSPMDVGGKRLRERAAEDQSNGKRIRTGHPSLADVIRQAILGQALSRFISKLEPMIRNAVREEVENKINGARLLPRSPQVQIQPALETPEFRLSFSKPISTPIFSQIKIEDEEGAPLQISLEHFPGGTWHGPVALPASVRVELVALDGQLSPDEWTREEFERSVVKERTGRRPLIVGDTSVTVKCGGPTTIPSLMFTDNSSWIRCRRFRIGARVVAGSREGSRIREAITEAFVVKDHRGDLYKKHYPPRLDDNVWRLKKIAKDGKFHKRLARNNINTVQDFLKVLSVQPNQLKQTLRMPDNIWDTTLAHANTCPKGTNIYLFRKLNAIFAFDSTCQLEAVVSDGHLLYPCNLDGEIKERVDQMKCEACEQWDSLPVIQKSALDDVLIQSGLMLPQGNAAEASSRFEANNQHAAATTSYGPPDQDDEDFGPWGLLDQISDVGVLN